MSFHLMTIIEIEHFDNKGKSIWKQENISNVFHEEGQEFLLANVFDTDFGVSVPSNYYIGLDNRDAIDVADDLSLLSGEPVGNGYARQTCSSTTGFTVGTFSGVKKARSAVKTFTASGGPFDEVQNVFLCTSADDSGFLISSTALSSSRILLDGENLALRISLSLNGC